MKLGFRFRRFSALFWLLLFTAYSVAAMGVVILDAADGGLDGLSGVSTVTIHADEEMRSLGASQLAAVYRARSGVPFMSLPPGSTVKVVWPDGSSEYVVVVDPASRTGMKPVPGTQQSAPDGAGAGSMKAPAREEGF